MYITVSFDDFAQEFANCGRENQFSLSGLALIFGHYTELEENLDKEMELDVIEICCDWTEYSDLEELKEECSVESLEELKEKTTVLVNEKKEEEEEESYIVRAYQQ